MDPKEWLFDRRVVKRNLKKAIYTLREYEEHLAKLKDVAGNTETLDLSTYEKKRSRKIEDSRSTSSRAQTGRRS